jgi:hypothetical protein
MFLFVLVLSAQYLLISIKNTRIELRRALNKIN